MVIFEIDPSLPNPNRVWDAIRHWEEKTRIRFLERHLLIPSPQGGLARNYVRFTPGSECNSSDVGMKGEKQDITLASDCSSGNVIHEIGHAIGLWHEQSREDRDLYVTINKSNIQAGKEGNFDQHITDGDDFGPYDYGSIMHYPRDAFSKPGSGDTITPKNPSASIGQRTGLSNGDIAAVRQMYYPSVIPKRKFIDDGISFGFGTGSIAARPRGPGSIKAALDQMPLGHPGSVYQAGTLRPFSMATPHHAPMAQGSAAVRAGGANPTSYLSELEQQLLDLEAAIAEANATSTQANAKVAQLQEAYGFTARAYEDALRQFGGAT